MSCLWLDPFSATSYRIFFYFLQVLVFVRGEPLANQFFFPQCDVFFPFLIGGGFLRQFLLLPGAGFGQLGSRYVLVAECNCPKGPGSIGTPEAAWLRFGTSFFGVEDGGVQIIV